MEQLHYNLLFRWFVGLGIDDPAWDVTVFTKNRDRLLGGEIASKFFGVVLGDARLKGLLSKEHVSVDGHADPGVGEHEELSGKGRLGRTVGSGPQRRARPPGQAGQARGRSNEAHGSTTDEMPGVSGGGGIYRGAAR